MKKIISLLLSVVLMVSSISVSFAQKTLSPNTIISDLNVNYQVNPLAIDRDKVRFGWKMESNGIGAMQNNYRIIVREGSDAGTVVWDSGTVNGGLAVGIGYEGPELKLETRYFWQVIVNSGTSNLVSDWAYFETGTDWTGTDWILPMKSLENEADPLTDEHRKAGNTFNISNSFTYATDDRNAMRDKYAAISVSGVAISATGSALIAAIKVEVNPTFYADVIDDILSKNPTAVIDRSDVLNYMAGLEQPMLYDLIVRGYIESRVNATGDLTALQRAQNAFNDIIGFVLNACVAANMSEQIGIAPHIIGWERTDNTTGVPSVNNLNNYARLGGNPLFRTEGQLKNEAIASATLYMTGLGNYQAFINGNKVMMADSRGKLVEPMFAPGATDNRLFTNYQGYDVTNMLTSGGKVALAAEMHKGYYGGRVSSDVFYPVDNIGGGIKNEAGISIATGTPWRLPGSTDNSRTIALRGKLIVTYKDGTKQVIGTNAEDWKTIAGPILFNDYYNGEFYDANIASAVNGWKDINFDDSAWYQAKDKGNIISGGETMKEITFDEAYRLSGSTLEPNNGAIAQFNDDLTQYPVETYKYVPSIVVRPSDTEFADSRRSVPTGNGVGQTHADVFTINRRGIETKIPVNATNTEGVFANPIVLQPGEVLSIDFGQNVSGVVEIDMAGQANSIIKVRHGEMINDNRVRANTDSGTEIVSRTGPDAPENTLYYGAMRSYDGQVSYYKLAGSARELWRPTSTYNGFQHAEISIHSGNAPVTIYAARAKVITSVHYRTSDIETNNPNVNKLIDNGYWGQVGNWTTIPTDCNQRTERAPWAGDLQVITSSALWNTDALPFYETWSEMSNRQAREMGGTFGSIIPAGWGWQWRRLSAGWSDAGVTVPWELFQKSGDINLIKRYFPQMERYTDLIYGDGPDALFPGDGGSNSSSRVNISSTWGNVGGSKDMDGNPILTRRQNNYYMTADGDWLAFKGSTVQFVSAIYQIYTTLILRDMAEATGFTDKAEKYQERYEILKANFLKPATFTKTPATDKNNRYGAVRTDGGFVYDDATAAWMTNRLKESDVTSVYNSELIRVSGDLVSGGPIQGTQEGVMDNSQTALVWALRLGLYRDEAHRQQLIDNLAANMQNKDNLWRGEPQYSLGVGFIGVNALLPVASDVGLSSLSYKAVQQDKVPGWMAPIRNGATTMWERWNSFDKDFGFGQSSMNSFNHFSYGSVNEWFYEYMVGIKQDAKKPGFKEIILQPTFDAADYTDLQINPLGNGNYKLAPIPITEVAGYYESLYGRIESGWKTTRGIDGKDLQFVEYKCTVPANTTATLYLPVDESLTNNLSKYDEIGSGLVYLGREFNNGVNCAKFDVKSGGYVIKVTDGKLIAQ